MRRLRKLKLICRSPVRWGPLYWLHHRYRAPYQNLTMLAVKLNIPVLDFREFDLPGSSFLTKSCYVSRGTLGGRAERKKLTYIKHRQSKIDPEQKHLDGNNHLFQIKGAPKSSFFNYLRFRHHILKPNSTLVSHNLAP